MRRAKALAWTTDDLLRASVPIMQGLTVFSQGNRVAAGHAGQGDAAATVPRARALLGRRTATPPFADSAQAAAHANERERYKSFVEALGRQLQLS